MLQILNNNENQKTVNQRDDIKTKITIKCI